MHTNRPESYPVEGQDAAQMSCKIYVGNLAWAFANPEQAKRAIETMYDSELLASALIYLWMHWCYGNARIVHMFSVHGRRVRVNVANQLVRGGGPGAGDYQMNSGAQGGYNYPTAPYPGGAVPYGGYSHPPPPAHGGYMGGGYMNPPNQYAGNEAGAYTTGAPTNHPMPDGRKGSNQPGGFYPNGSSYPYPPGGYGY
ncbi:hypothetical protein PTTG_00401 [Puccinia triticina 1-1 BBBD Race 1]|uniref:Uncharacterized protein n=2 Tax=Puccinia triticina TaxID=208348 RepID=A0A0C4EI35_PUCT1|nr:uncharacterized protein PtA15_8A499 [Puccinia triticina]OAV98354.1 hypothetical protein PTTG_00401 [Puccinia triticina 1-1 BBBD Race 1]WAQ87595.1 hypothetical protein PtA15_8A499 [Puccinia triticina]WAR57444.1 hypothetical protein PtB15_8B491 [Puccinia triticina]